MSKTKTSGVITSGPRSRVNVTLPQATLGWSDLVVPRSFEEGVLGNYSTNIHWDDARRAQAAEILQEAFDQAYAKFVAEFEGDARVKRPRGADAETWLTDKTTSNEKETLGDYVRFQLKAKEGVSKKSGKPYKIAPRLWDPNKKILDAAKLDLGRDSVVCPVVSVGFYTSALIKTVEPSIRLEGLVVLKRVTKSGNSAGAFQDDLDGLVDNPDVADDLAAFAATATFGGSRDPDVDEDEDGSFDPFA